MITVNEAYAYLRRRWEYLDGDVIELITHLQTENEQLKSTMAEIRKRTTGTRALDVALAKIKELEDGVKDVSEFIRLDLYDKSFKYYEEYGQQYNEIRQEILDYIKHKFNLGE